MTKTTRNLVGALLGIAAIVLAVVCVHEIKAIFGPLGNAQEVAEACFDERLDTSDLPVDVVKTIQPENYLGMRNDYDDYRGLGVAKAIRVAWSVNDQPGGHEVIEFIYDVDTEKIIGWEVYDYYPASLLGQGSI